MMDGPNLSVDPTGYHHKLQIDHDLDTLPFREPSILMNAHLVPPQPAPIPQISTDTHSMPSMSHPKAPLPTALRLKPVLRPNRSKHRLNAHMRAPMGDMKASMDQLENMPDHAMDIQCPYCHVVVKSVLQIVQHANENHPFDKFICSQCKRTFGTNGQLKRHMKEVHCENQWICEWEGCGRAFSRKERLIFHKRKHVGDRPFVCRMPQCGETFVRKEHLYNHILTSHKHMNDWQSVYPDCMTAQDVVAKVKIEYKGKV
ncbi:C2H2-type zinc finger [Carpediemonas membranifera]|uniref:C2H2-type zinc finger n=1 Tax=Carpediemonas membranifera TaxID=201153 RepID=A0A8J6BBL8_9EUKA|nr:C2H2-type zinc finger [Carpediemonas membranifera]|eukprot:KAG9397364.1 C2H2-type zinc finger [Carpediemonas membranifera]